MFFLSFCPASRIVFPNKKPAIGLTIAGFSEIFGYALENSTHDAKRRGAAMPNGHASFGQPGTLRCKRVCHFLTALEDTILGPLSKKLCGLEIRWERGSATRSKVWKTETC
ncbi:MAG TPA: hypothetical protein VN873_12240 [Candidatus Angelobacter sp.]|nr:hypothetical protein [Candidatus Angelobacter sp.]